MLSLVSILPLEELVWLSAETFLLTLLGLCFTFFVCGLLVAPFQIGKWKEPVLPSSFTTAPTAGEVFWPLVMDLLLDLQYCTAATIWLAQNSASGLGTLSNAFNKDLVSKGFKGLDVNSNRSTRKSLYRATTFSGSLSFTNSKESKLPLIHFTTSGTDALFEALAMPANQQAQTLAWACTATQSRGDQPIPKTPKLEASMQHVNLYLLKKETRRYRFLYTSPVVQSYKEIYTLNIDLLSF